jgi:hypothetical protein
MTTPLCGVVSRDSSRCTFLAHVFPKLGDTGSVSAAIQFLQFFISSVHLNPVIHSVHKWGIWRGESASMMTICLEKAASSTRARKRWSEEEFFDSILFISRCSSRLAIHRAVSTALKTATVGFRDTDIRATLQGSSSQVRKRFATKSDLFRE